MPYSGKSSANSFCCALYQANSLLGLAGPRLRWLIAKTRGIQLLKVHYLSDLSRSMLCHLMQ